MNDGTIKGMLAYLDSVVEKGYSTSTVVRPLKNAVTKIFEVSGDGWQDRKIADVNVEEAMMIFKHKTSVSNMYTDVTYQTYQSRLNRAIGWYQKFMANPGWNPGTGSKAKSPKRPAQKSVVEPSKAPAQAFLYTKADQNQPTDLIDFPYPLTNGNLVSLRLPAQLTRVDAERLTKFIDSLVVEKPDQIRHDSAV